MLKKNAAYIKLLIGTTIGTLIIASAIMVNFQNRKIDKLEDELYLKQQNEQRASDYYQSILNEKTIQTKFNTLQEYSILKDCTVQMDHTYEYSKDGVCGVKKHMSLHGHGDLQYNAVVNFSTATVTSINNGRDIIIRVDAPYIDLNSIKLVPNTLVMDKTQGNLFTNKRDGAEAQKLYMDSFVQSGTNKIIETYGTFAKQEYLNRAAKTEIHNLVRALNLNNCNIIVEIIK
jgi:hypothetical protein